jgi:hypothetical protein
MALVLELKVGESVDCTFSNGEVCTVQLVSTRYLRDQNTFAGRLSFTAPADVIIRRRIHDDPDGERQRVQATQLFNLKQKKQKMMRGLIRDGNK